MASSSKASRLPKSLCALYSRSARRDPRRPNAPSKPHLRNRRSGRNGWSRCLNTIKQDLNQLVRK